MTKHEMFLFGEQIRKLQEEKELPLRKVAVFIDIDLSLLGKIERNERQPSKEFIKQIVFFLKLMRKI